MALVVGLTGPPGGGKGSVARIIREVVEQRGIHFEYCSLSDEIRHEVARANIELRRDALKSRANLFRSRLGNGVWALIVASRVKEYLTNYNGDEVLVVVDGIRTPGEVRQLRTIFENDEFRLLSITAPPDVLMKNLQRREREDDVKSVLQDEGALRSLIQSEMGSGEPEFGHDIAACMEMSDWPLIQNDGSLAQLESKVRSFTVTRIIPELKHSSAVGSAGD